MSRTPIIAGNWKMNKLPAESIEFARELAAKIAPFSHIERVIAPTFLSLAGVAQALKGTALQVAAQDAHWAANGAYTSQVSAAMLQGLVDYIIVGHSECRAYLSESDAGVNRKTKAILDCGIQAIVAVGESLQQNEAGETIPFVSAQVRAALDGIAADDMSRVVIAYEPIWAIGTGKSASGELANAIIKSAVRDSVRALYGDAIADAIRIQYGGSVKPSNMAEFMSQPEIDGALVGGASLNADDFAALIEIAAQTAGG